MQGTGRLLEMLDRGSAIHEDGVTVEAVAGHNGITYLGEAAT